METKEILDILCNEIHSSVIATVDFDNKPSTRVIDIMLSKNDTIYFLTAKGKNFYKELINQKYISLSATKNNIAISLKGTIKPESRDLLVEIFEKNQYMKTIYPTEISMSALEVFSIENATGEYFDLSQRPIYRSQFTIGKSELNKSGYSINNNCSSCGKCINICPQKCIVKGNPYKIIQENCLHCGNCYNVCMNKAIEVR